jgi:hypothetical protein
LSFDFRRADDAEREINPPRSSPAATVTADAVDACVARRPAYATVTLFVSGFGVGVGVGDGAP